MLDSRIKEGVEVLVCGEYRAKVISIDEPRLLVQVRPIPSMSPPAYEEDAEIQIHETRPQLVKWSEIKLPEKHL